MAAATDRLTALTFLYATVLTGVAAGIYLAFHGYDDAGLANVLRHSGRIAFAVLILVFAARPLQQLLKKDWTARLLRNRRQLGVAFAGIHTMHLILIVLRVRESAEMTLGGIINLPASIVYVLIYAMLLTSFTAPARMIGRKGWTVLHKTGLFVVFAAFFHSQVPGSLDALEFANGLLMALASAAVAARIAAFVRRQR